MLTEFHLKTSKENFYDITAKVKETVLKSNAQNGVCIVFCPHTTAAITINENADPDVVKDMLFGLAAAFPDRAEFRHGEGNSAAHLKASSVGASETIIIANGALLLGTWQGVYFCEFDGPRSRRFYVNVLKSDN